MHIWIQESLDLRNFIQASTHAHISFPRLGDRTPSEDKFGREFVLNVCGFVLFTLFNFLWSDTMNPRGWKFYFCRWLRTICAIVSSWHCRNFVKNHDSNLACDWQKSFSRMINSVITDTAVGQAWQLGTKSECKNNLWYHNRYKWIKKVIIMSQCSLRRLYSEWNMDPAVHPGDWSPILHQQNSAGLSQEPLLWEQTCSEVLHTAVGGDSRREATHPCQPGRVPTQRYLLTRGRRKLTKQVKH